jgi:NAD/NADP transhydrogenase beta subunit
VEGSTYEWGDAAIDIVYLIASVFFIYGLKNMSHPRTAVRGCDIFFRP